jgi:hypothetical protein
MTLFKKYSSAFRAQLFFPWILTFLILNMLVRGVGGQNADSRFATMQAMMETQTFAIDPYIHWTDDWSKAKDGQHYSNKAPGPMLLGWPIYAITYWLNGLDPKLQKNETGLRTEKISPTPKIFFILFFQLLPFILLVSLLLQYLKKIKTPLYGQIFVALALLFGNTAALFMNTHFGHGITALFVLLALYALMEKHFLLLGLASGLALLCDYSAGFFLGLLIITLLLSKTSWRNFAFFILGGLAPAILWIWYHQSAFGSPFSIANHFQNPAFLDSTQESIQLWGVFTLPDAGRFFKLLLGPERGILFTQPWLLLSVGIFCFLIFRQNKVALWDVRLVLATFFCLLIMNSGFGAWHSGGSPGPRYLCYIFPAFAFLVGKYWQEIPARLIPWMWSGLGVSILFGAQVYATGLNPPITSLWSWQFSEIFSFLSDAPINQPYKPLGKWLLFYSLFAVGTFFQIKKIKDHA